MKTIIRKLSGARFEKASYSQCGEDIIIKFIFDSIGVEKPSYIDIGAHHPNYINNTALFYKHGSTGINIEPDPTLFKEFPRSRKRDVNINAGIADREGQLDFYIMSSPALNTFSKEEAENLKKDGYTIDKIQKIKVLPAGKIIDEYAGGRFPDFMTLDVEGYDMDILKAIEYERTSPTVICVETISFSNSGNGVKNDAIADLLKEKDYMIYADTYINTIFVKRTAWLNRK